MSSYSDSNRSRDWPDLEAGYWQTTQRIRSIHDSNTEYKYAARLDIVEREIKNLYDRKAELQQALEKVDGDIEFYKTERQRLSRAHDHVRATSQTDRRYEDQSQNNWFARARDNDREEAASRANNGVPQHGQTLPNPVSTWTSVNGNLRNSSRTQEQRSDLFGSVFHNPIEEDERPGSHPLSLSNAIAHPQADRGPMTPLTERNMRVADEQAGRSDARENVQNSNQERHGLPAVSILMANEGLSESPDDSRRSSHGRKSLPSIRDPASHSTSPPTSQLPLEDDKEITRASLVLQDNGSVIVHPPMFAGVPLEKIGQNHPFWNPEWEPLENTIQTALGKWTERLGKLQQTAGAVRHTVFLANRQVNRGQAIVRFLEEGCFHPLQFASREVMDKSYKTFINYDTVFRLVNVHEELKKFDLEVTPLEWLRQRLYEVSVAQGDKFSLSKTVHGLYHDAKLKSLREKNGFGNIGRPSGYKVGDKGGAKGTVKLKPKKEPSAQSLDEQLGENQNRKRRSITQFDVEDEFQAMTAVSNGGFLESTTQRLPKRPRLDFAPNDQESSPVKQEYDAALAEQEQEAAQAEFDYENYTSRDSFSGGRIMHLDFRVDQIKNKLITTRQGVTQYWTWKPEESMFEHEVLRDVRPNITWDCYREPYKFNCRLEDMIEIRYAQDSQKIVVVRADEIRGDFLVSFKRERTKKRFLAFAKKKAVKLVKTCPAYLEEAWASMISETVPDQ
ncbi:hypothetical protein GGS21DRAFT_486306 [Xylaria nigripes]|nr:hypothetical protein GGS21DRAFT_486306 [Xylaria nigripes]